MKDTDQIAADLVDAIRRCGGFYAAEVKVAQAAIEKALKASGKWDAETWKNNFDLAVKKIQELESRTAHANERTDDTKRVPDQDEAFENIVTAVLQCQKGTARQFFKSAIEKAVKPWEIQCQSLAKVIQEINASIERNAKHISDPAARTMIDVIGRKASRAAISQTKEKE